MIKGRNQHYQKEKGRNQQISRRGGVGDFFFLLLFLSKRGEIWRCQKYGKKSIDQLDWQMGCSYWMRVFEYSAWVSHFWAVVRFGSGSFEFMSSHSKYEYNFQTKNNSAHRNQVLGRPMPTSPDSLFWQISNVKY